jgi:membrane associated rhomboid family serine protease
LLPLKDDIPTRRFPVLTVAIIAICCIVYLIFERGGWDLGATGNERVQEYGAIPYEVTHPGEEVGTAPDQAPWYLTLFTSMFMHGSLLHLAGNMLFLWIFGNNIEDSMSRWRFAVFYVLGGLAALAAQVLVNTDSTIPTVGASGAIAGVLGGYALLYPRARVVTLVLLIFFITVIELPALLVLGAWFVFQIIPATQDITGEGGGVAYFAHIGGFVFGLLLIKLFANRVHEDYDAPQRLPVY